LGPQGDRKAGRHRTRYACDRRAAIEKTTPVTVSIGVRAKSRSVRRRLGKAGCVMAACIGHGVTPPVGSRRPPTRPTPRGARAFLQPAQTEPHGSCAGGAEFVFIH
jgi:hypothetical protein